MKVNPVAIQAYQQLTPRSQSGQTKTETNKAANREESVALTPKPTTESSKLAVKPNVKNYGELLTSDERQALELLFSKFRNPERFGLSASAESGAESKQSLGRVIDIKV